MTLQRNKKSRQTRASILGATLLSMATFGMAMPSASLASEQQATLESTILERDALFWKAYNECELDQLPKHIDQNVEFYHDKGGLMEGLEQLTMVLNRSKCNPKGKSMRRQVIDGTVKVYPINNYGAIISGEHKFYVTEPGQEEQFDSTALFTHVWQFKDNQWKMTRVLSYAHVLSSEEPSK